MRFAGDLLDLNVVSRPDLLGCSLRRNRCLQPAGANMERVAARLRL